LTAAVRKFNPPPQKNLPRAFDGTAQQNLEEAVSAVGTGSQK